MKQALNDPARNYRGDSCEGAKSVVELDIAAIRPIQPPLAFQSTAPIVLEPPEMTDRLLPASNPPRGIARSRRVALSMPFIRPVRAADRSLKVSTFGGYFERMFVEHVYPAFTKATGIAVQSIEQPEGAQLLFQLARRIAGSAPMDLCCHGWDRCAARRAQEHLAEFRLQRASPTSPSFGNSEKGTRFRQCRRHVLVHDVRGQPGGVKPLPTVGRAVG